MKLVDLTGQVFGRWKVLKRAGNKGTNVAWLCECQCPKKTTKPVRGGRLCSGDSKSCGCLKRDKLIDLTGQVFERWKVIKRLGSDNHGKAQWLCECQCEKKTRTPIPGGSLRSGNSKSCGCLMRELVSKRKLSDITGQIFGRLKVLKRVKNNNHGKAQWLCECQCKKRTRKTLTGGDLRTGNTKSCGCLNRELVHERSSKPLTIAGKVISRDRFAEILGLTVHLLNHHLRRGKTPDEIADMVLEKRIR